MSCILSMEPMLYPIIQKLSSNWYHSLKNWADCVCKPIEKDLKEKYYGLLKIRKCYTESATIKFCGKTGIRVDRVIQCEILTTPFQSAQTLKVACNTRGSKIKKGCRTVFQIDVVHMGCKRSVWVHRDLNSCYT